MKFELSKKEEKLIEKFEKKQRKKDPDEMGSVGGRFSYIVTPTGIGILVGVRDNLLNEEKDVTDFNNW